MLDGETLREKLDAGKLPLSKAVDYARQVAAGLSAAHAAGITHRDIKPENLFVTGDGRLKILDFGLAKLAVAPTDAAETQLQAGTAAGVVLGTVGYMSPEQVKGQAADHRADLFGLGVVLYEMLAGVRPFSGDTAVQTMNAILTEDPPEIDREARAMPPALGHLVRHCLEKNPEERFQSARDLAFALEALSATSVGSSIGSQAAIGAISEPSKTRPKVLPLVTATLAGLVLLLGTALYLGPTGNDLASYRFRAFATDPEVESSPAWSPDGRTIAYVKDMGGTSQLFIRQLDIDEPVPLTTGDADVSAPFWWPDSSRLGFVRDGDVLTISRAGGEPGVLQNPDELEGIAIASLSPDGETLAMLAVDAENKATLYLASPADATPVKYEPAPFEQTCCTTPNYLQFSPDGGFLFFSHFGLYRDGGNPTAWLIPVPAGNAAPRELFLSAGLSLLQSLDGSWMPDGRHLVVSLQALDAPAPGLWLADVEKETLTPITANLQGLRGPSVSPDGSRIALTSGGPDFDLVEIPLDGSPVRDLLATSRNEYGGAWIPNSSQFVYVTDRNGPQELRLRSEAEGTDRRIAIETAMSTGTVVGAPVASPDGQRVAYHSLGVGGGGVVWIAPVGGGTPTPLYQEDGIQVAPAWSPDGQQLTTWRLGAGLSVMRVGGRDEPLVLDQAAHPEPIAAWSPDGQWIAYQTSDGLQLVSPDGQQRRSLTTSAAAGLGLVG